MSSATEKGSVSPERKEVFPWEIRQDGEAARPKKKKTERRKREKEISSLRGKFNVWSRVLVQAKLAVAGKTPGKRKVEQNNRR